jgi:DNA-binding NarL/FixJ family response regulator
VDDAVLITKRISEMIRELDCVSDIFISHDCSTALKNVEEYNPDMILLDIHLPDKSGIEFLEQMLSTYPQIKIIMVTNKASQYYRELCLGLGAHHFIDKSKEFEMIPSIIETYC